MHQSTCAWLMPRGGRAGELRSEKRAGDTLVLADRDGDGEADFSIRLDDPLALQKGDFIL